MSARLHAALAAAGVPFLPDEPLSRHTTIGIGGKVPALLLPRTPGELGRALEVVAGLDFPLRVLGAGSNLLADDAGLDFAVLATQSLSRPPVFDGVLVDAEAGTFLPRLVRETAERGLRGLEWAIGVPGSVGGALCMNAGAWGADMSRVVDAVWAIEAAAGSAVEQPFAPRFAYRSAGLGAGQIVARVRFRLRPGEPREALAAMEQALLERKRTQPVAARSAGCAFKNPPGDSAGRLIEAAGLKGLSRGAAVVSPLHGNFLLNRGGASAAEVLALLDELRLRVEEKSGIRLEDEIVRWRGSR